MPTTNPLLWETQSTSFYRTYQLLYNLHDAGIPTWEVISKTGLGPVKQAGENILTTTWPHRGMGLSQKCYHPAHKHELVTNNQTRRQESCFSLQCLVGSQGRILKASSFSLLVRQEATVGSRTGAAAFPHPTQVMWSPTRGRPEATDTNMPQKREADTSHSAATADSWQPPEV